jgi:lysylphosphatidylglycerol synthetase-like protein (DUF2156 family)
MYRADDARDRGASGNLAFRVVDERGHVVAFCHIWRNAKKIAAALNAHDKQEDKG